MARILIAYSTVDGHTLNICLRMEEVLAAQGHEVVLASLDTEPQLDPEPFDKVVVGASIRYGKHRPAVYDFAARNRAILEAKPNALFSVNLVARKPGRDLPERNPYLRRFLGQITWRPQLLAVFAGKLDYPRYSFWDRQVIRLIMWITHGPTDPAAVVEYTDWGKVEAFAERVARL